MAKNEQNKRSFKLIEVGILELTENGQTAFWVRHSNDEEKQAQIAEWINFGTPAGEQVCQRVIIEKMQTNKGEVVRETRDWIRLSYAATMFL